MIQGNDAKGINLNLDENVSAGDAIYFVVNQNGNIGSDATQWNPFISYVERASSAFGPKQGNDNWVNTKYEINKDQITGQQTQRVSDNNMGSGQFSGISQRIQVKAGKEYTASAQIRIESLREASVQLYVDFLDERSGFLNAYSTETTTNGEYVTLNIRETIPAKAKSALVYVILRSKNAGALGDFSINVVSFEYGTKTNLLYNGDMDAQSNAPMKLLKGWNRSSLANTGFESLKDTATGQQTQRIWDNNMKAGQFSGISQRIHVIGGKEYTASAQIRIELLREASVQLYIDFMDGRSGFLTANSTETTTNGEYVTLNLQGTIPAETSTARVYVILRAKSAGALGDISVNSINFEYGARNNLLYNGNMNVQSNAVMPLIKGWTGVSSGNTIFERLKDTITGQQTQRISDSNMGAGQFSGVSQRIGVQGGKEYTASARIRAEQLKAASVQLYIDFMDGRSGYLDAHSTETITTGKDVILNIQNTIPAGANTARVYIILRGKSAGASGDISVNSIRFEYGLK